MDLYLAAYGIVVYVAQAYESHNVPIPDSAILLVISIPIHLATCFEVCVCRHVEVGVHGDIHKSHRCIFRNILSQKDSEAFLNYIF